MPNGTFGYHLCLTDIFFTLTTSTGKLFWLLKKDFYVYKPDALPFLTFKHQCQSSEGNKLNQTSIR